MTDTDITRLALEAGLHRVGDFWFSDDPEQPEDVSHVDLARFAALVAEECAKVCERQHVDHEDLPESEGYLYDAAAAIRAKFKA